MTQLVERNVSSDLNGLWEFHREYLSLMSVMILNLIQVGFFNIVVLHCTLFTLYFTLYAALIQLHLLSLKLDCLLAMGIYS